jgi:hypothetical protein
VIERIVVVGASTAGLATVESLREAGFGGEVVLLGAEHWDPYRRPALSKQILLGTWQSDQARLLSPYPISFFWSEIHGARVQAWGRLDVADSVELLAGDHDSDQALFGFRAGDRACGLVAWNMPKPVRTHRATLLAEEPADRTTTAHLLETS